MLSNNKQTNCKRRRAKSSGEDDGETNNMPKRPMTAYNYFVQEENRRMTLNGEDHSVGIISRRWREVEGDALEAYHDRAAADSERYQCEKEAFYEEKVRAMCCGGNNRPVPAESAEDGDGTSNAAVGGGKQGGATGSADGGGKQSPAEIPPAGVPASPEPSANDGSGIGTNDALTLLRQLLEEQRRDRLAIAALICQQRQHQAFLAASATITAGGCAVPAPGGAGAALGDVANIAAGSTQRLNAKSPGSAAEIRDSRGSPQTAPATQLAAAAPFTTAKVAPAAALRVAEPPILLRVDAWGRCGGAAVETMGGRGGHKHAPTTQRATAAAVAAAASPSAKIASAIPRVAAAEPPEVPVPVRTKRPRARESCPTGGSPTAAAGSEKSAERIEPPSGGSSPPGRSVHSARSGAAENAGDSENEDRRGREGGSSPAGENDDDDSSEGENSVASSSASAVDPPTAKKRAKWTPYEDELIIAAEDRMSWKEMEELLGGRRRRFTIRARWFRILRGVAIARWEGRESEGGMDPSTAAAATAARFAVTAFLEGPRLKDAEKKGDGFTPYEDELVIAARDQMAYLSWARIAELVDRPRGSIKNRWFSRLWKVAAARKDGRGEDADGATSVVASKARADVASFFERTGDRGGSESAPATQSATASTSPMTKVATTAAQRVSEPEPSPVKRPHAHQSCPTGESPTATAGSEGSVERIAQPPSPSGESSSAGRRPATGPGSGATSVRDRGARPRLATKSGRCAKGGPRRGRTPKKISHNAGGRRGEASAAARTAHKSGCHARKNTKRKWTIDRNVYENADEQERLFREAAQRVRTKFGSHGGGGGNPRGWDGAVPSFRVLSGDDDGASSSSATAAARGPVFERPVEDVASLPSEHWRWTDPSARLGLPRSSGPAAAKRNFRRLALLYHPDKVQAVGEGAEVPGDGDGGDDVMVHARFHAIKDAYEVLSRGVG